jgi:hypothetical protein
VDGVAVLPSWVPPTAFLQAMARTSSGRVASRLLLGGWAFTSPPNLVVPNARLADVVVATMWPRDEGPAAWQRYVASFRKTYPRQPDDVASGALVVPYRNAMASFVAAFDAVDGDTGRDGEHHREALARITLPTVPDPTTLDENRQGIVSVYLSRVGSPGAGADGARTVEVVRNVDQAYGGIFGSAGAPTAVSPSCDRAAAPPSWAR